MSLSTAPMKYVGYCDILGFSSAVLNDYETSIALYQQFQSEMQDWPFATKAQVSVYSDSILITSDDLPSVLHTIISLHWVTLRHGWLIRGGIAYGKYWEEKENGNLFVVSDALIKAVGIEKTIKVPAVVLSEDIPLGIEAWAPRFIHGIFEAPLLHFQGLNIVNPFNPYWFNSALIRAKNLLDKHPNHREKYEWFLSLAESVAKDDILIPEAALTQMLELGILQKHPEQPV